MQREQKPVTLKDVAQAASVHFSVVGKVLNGGAGNSRVGAETRERVLRAARELGYRPNEAARGLRRGVSNVVGLLCGDLRNPFFADLAAELESALQTRGLSLQISHVAGQEQSRREDALLRLRQQAVCASLVWTESPQAASPEGSLAGGARVLEIGFTRGKRPGCWLDQRRAVKLAVGELMQRGARRLGFYAPNSAHESPARLERERLFAEVCRACALPAPVCLHFPGESWEVSAAAASAAAAFADHSEVEGWLGFNDVASMGLLMHAPRHLARAPVIFCFDGTPWARQWPEHPPCLDLRLPELAQAAADWAAGDPSMPPPALRLIPRLHLP